MAEDLVKAVDAEDIEAGIVALLDPPTKRYYGGSVQYTVRLMPNAAEVIDATAQAMGMTRADLMRAALADYLGKYKKDLIEVDY